jgi:hypothetical protein
MSPELSYPSVAIFGGEYNAKGLELRRLVERFVPPKVTFGRLLQGNNTVLVGPRGSGKTTLMMMLQSAALELYEGPEAERFRDAVGYSGVLVPGDQSWAKQLDALQLDAEGGELFAVSVFTLHCLRALVRAALERTRPAVAGIVPYRRVSIAYDEEQQMARAVARAWRLPRPVADLADLAAALDDAILDVSILRSTLALCGAAERTAKIAAEPLLHLEMIAAALSLVERFNALCSEPEGRWAFLFDEAELVPPVINRLIVRLLRGTDRLFLFKVSYAPYENVQADFGQPLGAQEGNDFTTLRLTYANKREAFPFTEELLRFRLRNRAGPDDPDQVLGSNSLVALDEGSQEADAAGAYAPGSAYGLLLGELAAKDQTFVAWLQANRIELEHAHELEENLRARLRKVMPIVALRVAYLRDPTRQTGKRRLRGRRNVPLYSGKEAFYSMMEANPRWLNHVCDRLLDDAGSGMITPERQSRQLLDAAEEFESYLRILPVRGTHLEMNDAPKRLLHRIAEFFREQYIGGPFTADPCGSFIVDREFSDTVLRSLRALINRGALVEVPAGGGLGELIGTRFRCAYIVAPIYGLPLRLDKAVRLSSVLAASPYQQMSLDAKEEE